MRYYAADKLRSVKLYLEEGYQIREIVQQFHIGKYLAKVDQEIQEIRLGSFSRIVFRQVMERGQSETKHYLRIFCYSKSRKFDTFSALVHLAIWLVNNRKCAVLNDRME